MRPVYRQLLALLLAVVLGSALCLSLYIWDNKYTRPGAQPMDGLLTLTDEEFTGFLTEINQTALKYMDIGVKEGSRQRQITLISSPTDGPGSR